MLFDLCFTWLITLPLLYHILCGKSIIVSNQAALGCGMVGVAGALEYKDEALTKRMLLLDVFRGADSTGLAAVRNSGEILISKIASHPLDLFDMAKFKTALNATSSKVFLGHNRSMTRGAINTINAHPFQFGHIVGAHNGTLDLVAVNRLEEALGEKFPVDSQAVFAGIAELGLKKTIELLTGAWALTWYDTKEETINFLRNKERPLWYAYSKEFDKLFWASEWPMIEAATHMGSGYELFLEPDTGYNFFETEPDVHYCWNVNDLKKGSKSRPKAKAKTIKGRAAPVAAADNHSPFERRGNPMGFQVERQTSGTGNSTNLTNTSGTSSPLLIRHVMGDSGNPLGGFVSREKFDEIAKFGCSWCQTDVEYGDVGISLYERDDVLLCSDCTTHAGDQSRIYSRNPILAAV